MKTFSQRMGFAKFRTAIQTDDLDEPTRNALWNIVGPFFRRYANKCSVYTDIWTELYHNTSDTWPRAAGKYDFGNDHYYSFYRTVITENPWNECMDLIEFINQTAYRDKWDSQIFTHSLDHVVPLPDEYNSVFVKYMVGYRIVEDQVLPITNEEEKSAVETAARKSPDAVAEQISKAIRFLGDRQHPDYAKSVDCSISAVEAQCRILLNDPDPTLGKALKMLDDKGIPLHGSLKAGFDKLYGFTSDANGIRHAGIAPSDVDADLAKFMLVACSAFVNYLRSKQ